MSSLKQIVVKNATTMSLHERFTKIRKNKDAATSGDRMMQQLASNRNRRLAQQMERRPSVAAALRRDSIKTRLGVPGAISVRDRLRFPRAFVARRGRGGSTGKSPLTRGLTRATAMDVDAPATRRRARSPFVSNKIAAQRRSRSRSRSRPPIRTVRTARSRSRSRARSNSVGRLRARSSSRSRFGSTLSLRGQFSGRRINYRRGRGGGRLSRSDLKSYRPTLSGPFRRRGSFRGRGRGRGRGRASLSIGRGRGRGGFRGASRGRGRVPTKEELDRDLDQYMSTTKANLDKDLDNLMSTESWD